MGVAFIIPLHLQVMVQLDLDKQHILVQTFYNKSWILLTTYRHDNLLTYENLSHNIHYYWSQQQMVHHLDTIRIHYIWSRQDDMYVLLLVLSI